MTPSAMTEDQIKHMVARFLSWRLPEDFSPDGGISFEKAFNQNTPYPMEHEPVGTNLFNGIQAEAMVRHMIEGMPGSITFNLEDVERIWKVFHERWQSGTKLAWQELNILHDTRRVLWLAKNPDLKDLKALGGKLPECLKGFKPKRLDDWGRYREGLSYTDPDHDRMMTLMDFIDATFGEEKAWTCPNLPAPDVQLTGVSVDCDDAVKAEILKLFGEGAEERNGQPTNGKG